MFFGQYDNKLEYCDWLTFDQYSRDRKLKLTLEFQRNEAK